MDQTSRIFAAAAGQSQPFASTKFANMLVDPYSTSDIAVYGNTVVVVGNFADVVGISANLCYSTDGGSTWVGKQLLDSSNIPYSFSSITVNTTTGQFFAVSGTSVLTSTNGAAWSLASTLVTSASLILFFPAGPYQYVILAGISVLTSPDGVTWTLRNNLPSSGFFAAYGNGFFVVGGSGFIRRTADFITYTTPTVNELTGGLSAANFLFIGAVYKGTTFILSATATSPAVFKSTDSGANFYLSNISDAYYENINNGLFVSTEDSRSQVGGGFIDTAQAIANPNRGSAFSFSGTTYSLRTRKNDVITTTTGSPNTTGLSSLSSSGIYDSFNRSTTNLGLATAVLFYNAGSWRINYTNNSPSAGGSATVAAPSFNVNIINAYVAAGASAQITGYPFMLNNTFIVLFPNATTTFGGTEYNGSTIYTTTDLVTWTQASSLPAAFNVSGPGSLAYIVQFLRGEYGAGGYTFLMNYGSNTRYLTTAAFTSFALSILRNSGSPSTGPLNIIKGSANDNTGAAGWIAFVGDYYTFLQPLFAGIWLSNNIVSAGTPISVWAALAGLDGTLVLNDDVTDVAHINGQFRVYCKFTNLLGVLSDGVISVTTAGVQTHTIDPALTNIKVLGLANSTLYVISLTTGQAFSTTNGTTYTPRFIWNQPFLGKSVYEDSTGTVYTSGRLLGSVSTPPSLTPNWFTSADGATWAKTTITSPNSSQLLVRNVYPSKYARATSGNYVAIDTTFNAGSSGYLPVATSGSLSNMPYKRLVPYAVPMFIPSPVFYNATLSQYCSISAYYGASVTSSDGLLWSLNSGNFDVNTSTLVTVFSANYSYYTYAASAKLFYRFNSDAKYYAADPSTPTTYSLFSFPTIGTSYTGSLMSNIAFDGTTYMVVYYNAGTLNSFTSTDGASWLAAGNGTLVNVSPTIISSVTGSFLVYGSNTSAFGVFTSNTGSTWTSSVNFNFAASTIGGTTGYTYYQAAYGNGTYVMVGNVTGQTTTGPPFFFPIFTAYKRISTSSDGTTWTSVYPSTTTVGRFYAVTFTNLNSGFFIAGADGISATKIEYSNTNGTTWTAATINGTFTGEVREIIDGGASASPRFVAVTNSTSVITSDDGINWTVVTLAAIINQGYVSFLNGRWMLTSRNDTSNDLMRCAILTSG